MEILADAMPDKAAIPRSTDGMVDIQSLLRLLAEQVVNAIMDEEADQLCGDGANSRNGYRNRTLETCVGTLNLRIHKLRTGSFFPEDVLERHQRVDRALVAAVAEMHDAAFRMGAAGEHDWAELEKAARKMIASSLELADSVEAA